MRRFRQIALTILFAGWMLPAFMAQAARARAPKSAAKPRTPFEAIAGEASPPPAPAEQAASMFNGIAGVWFLAAVIYAGVLTVRLRRTLVR